MSTEHESFLTDFFHQMNTHFPQQWCVLHSYETLPYFSKSDVDMAFNGGNLKKLESIIRNVAQMKNWSIYQKLWYDVQQCYYYVLKNNENNVYLAIDFLVDQHGIGRYQFKTDSLTKNCNFVHEFIPVPNHSTAFCYKLVKRLEKKIDLNNDYDYLMDHYHQADVDAIDAILENHYGRDGLKIIQSHLLTHNLSITLDERMFLKKQKNYLFWKRLKFIPKAIWEIKRKINRIFHPRGLIIYIPKLPKDDLTKFLMLLNEKRGLLFRFFSFNSNNSLFESFKGLIGSTLVVVETKNFDAKKAIKTHWLFPSHIKIDVTKTHFNDIDTVTEIYMCNILQIMQKANP